MSKIIPHEISMKKRRRKLNIKNFPNQSRKLKSKNQAQVKMKVVMMKKGECCYFSRYIKLLFLKVIYVARVMLLRVGCRCA